MARRSKASQALDEVEGLREEEEWEDEEEQGQAFDFNKYTITSNVETKVLEIDGTSFEVKVKPLSWSIRNQILSRSLKWDNAGSTVFDGDAYVRECLKEIILQAPWGRTTESFLVSIDSRLGGLLETLVPKAFEEEGGTDVEAIKKGA